MTDSAQKKYHCENCNAVFNGMTPLPKDAVCTECGERPFSNSGFASVTNLAKVEDTDQSHGVPGQDVADFVSMQKVRRKRQARMAIYLWVGLLVVGVGLAMYHQQDWGGDSVEQNEFIVENREFQKKSRIASNEALKVYDKFLASKDENEESQYIVDGVSKLLLLKNHTDSISAFKPTMPLQLLMTGYSDEGEYPRVELMFKDGSSKQFEAVFWQTSDGWKLDWEHYVRFSASDWGQFLARPTQNNDQEFRLYVRRRHVGSGGSQGKLQLVFYMPSVVGGSRLLESPQVNLASDSPIFAELNDGFDELEKVGDDRLIGHNDSAGFLRVKATLGFEPDSEGKPKLELKSIQAQHWMEFDLATDEVEEND